ncbi:MAG: DUF4097 family beta strand repeat protein [Gemmatimonadaceae bacterium]|nr:DUF4097 family beta strand repeat protein [Gemmatimonadaceae bacterium]
MTTSQVPALIPSAVRRHGITLLAGAALLSLATVQLGAQASERHALRGELVEIWNLAGRATVEAGTGSEVVVEVRRGGSDASRLQIEVRDGRLVVRYPDRDIVYRDERRGGSFETRLHVRNDGTFSNDWDDRDGRSTRIRSSGGGLEAYADLVIRVPRNQRLELNLGVGRIETSEMTANLTLRTRVSHIAVRGLTGELVARTGSGGVTAERVKGDVDISTGSGGVDLREIEGQVVKLRAGSGTVEGDRVNADRFDANTGSGGVEMRALGANEIRAGTGSGGVRLELTKVAATTMIRTGSGGVRLALPASPNVEVDVTTGSGGISSDFPVTMDQVRRNSLRGTIGTGADGRIRASSGSGGVRLVKRP